MSQHNTSEFQSVPSATDSEIQTAVDALATCYGRTFIRPETIYTRDMRANGEALAILLGVPAMEAAKLPDGELTAYYAVARKAPAAARRMASKRFQTVPTAPVPAMPTGPIPAADMAALLAAMETQLSAELVALEKRLMELQPRKVEITVPNLPPITVDHAHKILPRVLRKAMGRDNVYLVGGVGTGKTTLAKQIAGILDLPYYMAASVFEEHKLFGYMDARGEYVTTDFRRAYEFGGIFLFDELDRSDPSVVVMLNAAAENGYCAFPDRRVERHPNFVLLAAGNTAMRGPSRKFNSAQKQDASALERYCVIRVDLDETLETALCINPAWLKYVRALRAEVSKQSVEDLDVSPRASIRGAEAIAKGDTWEEAATGLIWKELDAPTRERLERAVPMSRYCNETGVL